MILSLADKLNMNILEMTDSKPSIVTANIDVYAHDIYLNPKIKDGNKVEDKMDAISLIEIIHIFGLKDRQGPILDMGYGTGLMLHELINKHGLQVDLLEGSAVLCEQAKKEHGNNACIHHSLFETFTTTKKYAHILALHVLEHVDHPVQVLQQMMHALSPRGRMLVFVPNAHSLHRRLAVQMKLQKQLDSLSPKDHLVGHQRVFTPETLKACALEAGFEIEHFFGLGLKTLPYSMMESWSEDLIRACVQISPTLPAELLANIGLVLRKPA